MKFNKLSPEAQKRAANDYIRGWEVTHLKNDLSLEDAIKILQDSNENFYPLGLVFVKKKPLNWYQQSLHNIKKTRLATNKLE
jgi:hypothetical protein